MQVRKVAVVATGALATAAAMGSSPAFAADSDGHPEVAPATLGVLEYEGKHRASDEAMRALAEQWLTVAPEQTTTWSAPWDQDDTQILSLGSGSAVSVAPWQMCGSHGPWAGGVSVPVDSPATVLGDCRNGTVAVNNGGGDDDALFSILDGTAVSALSFQQCGSGAGVLGGSAPISSPATVGGSCDNGNVSVATEDEDPYPDDPGYGYYQPGSVAEDAAAETEDAAAEATEADAVEAEAEASADAEAVEASGDAVGTAEAASQREEQTVIGSGPWEDDDTQIVSAGDGSAASGLPWQMCGSPGPWAGGASAPIDSPMTVLGDCRNGNLDIHGDAGDALFSALNGSGVSAGAFQMCGSGVGVAGATAPVSSPMTVGGSCDNGNIMVG